MCLWVLLLGSVTSGLSFLPCSTSYCADYILKPLMQWTACQHMAWLSEHTVQSPLASALIFLACTSTSTRCCLWCIEASRYQSRSRVIGFLIMKGVKWTERWRMPLSLLVMTLLHGQERQAESLALGSSSIHPIISIQSSPWPRDEHSTLPALLLFLWSCDLLWLMRSLEISLKQMSLSLFFVLPSQWEHVWVTWIPA